MTFIRSKTFISSALVSSLLLSCNLTFAAKPIDLSKYKISTLNNFVLEEISRSVDFNQTLHIRVQQTFEGVPVLGADGVIHIPAGKQVSAPLHVITKMAAQNQGSADGTFYQNLAADLANIPAGFAKKRQADQAVDTAIKDYQQEAQNKSAIKDLQQDFVIYVDEAHKAHWAFRITFLAPALKKGQVPLKLVYIIDAASSHIYEKWNDMKTVEPTLESVAAGGFGGNKKMGKLVYDGLNGHLPVLNVERDAAKKICYFQNESVKIKKCTLMDPWFGCQRSKDFSLSCESKNPEHNNVYWNADMDAVNDGYSPSNDALFAGKVIDNMYREWYDVPVLTNSDGTPMILTMVVHLSEYDNAYWDGRTMNFGDGADYFYPLTSLGVASHEISHGFTEQHSNLTYRYESGGMNEAFSDMAAQAAEVYAYGKNSWQIGPEIFKAENEALRYMDQPSKDCKGKTPGTYCSIDDASQYKNSLDVHYSSGVYNRAFYLLASSEGWNVRKAFDVMVQANRYYWTSNSTFIKGACGVIKAAKDYGYDVEAVKKAFGTVKVDISSC